MKCSYTIKFSSVLELERGDGWLPNVVGVLSTTELHTLKESVVPLWEFHLDLKEKGTSAKPGPSACCAATQAGAGVLCLPPSSLSAQAR